MFLPLLQGFSERQARLFLMLAAVVSKHQAEALQTLGDDDVAQAADALASTLETAGRGILYEHRPASLAAARLTSELKAMIDEVKNAGSALERDAAIALRRLEQAAKTASATTSSTPSVLQQLFARVLAPPSGGDKQDPAGPASSIIFP